jgi:DNA-binding NtrC family response regulator
MMGKTNILVLDDDPQELELIKWNFDKGGVVNYEMFTEIDVFFDHFDNDVFLAVVDYRLGGKTAVQVADKIQELNDNRDGITKCEVIIISGTPDIRVPAYFMNSKKADYFIVKDGLGEYYLELVVYARKAIDRQTQAAETETRLEQKKEFYHALSIPPDERK